MKVTRRQLRSLIIETLILEEKSFWEDGLDQILNLDSKLKKAAKKYTGVSMQDRGMDPVQDLKDWKQAVTDLPSALDKASSNPSLINMGDVLMKLFIIVPMIPGGAKIPQKLLPKISKVLSQAKKVFKNMPDLLKRINSAESRLLKTSRGMSSKRGSIGAGTEQGRLRRKAKWGKDIEKLSRRVAAAEKQIRVDARQLKTAYNNMKEFESMFKPDNILQNTTEFRKKMPKEYERLKNLRKKFTSEPRKAMKAAQKAWSNAVKKMVKTGSKGDETAFSMYDDIVKDGGLQDVYTDMAAKWAASMLKYAYAAKNSGGKIFKNDLEMARIHIEYEHKTAQMALKYTQQRINMLKRFRADSKKRMSAQR